MSSLDVQMQTLPNGMRLVTVPMPGLKSVTVLSMVGVGSRFESAKRAGISHFLEHLPFKGTEKYPDSMAVAEAVDGVGGKHNAFTSKEYTGYWVKLASSKYQVALDVVSDLLLTARLRPEDIEREKGVIVEELNMYEDEPQAKVSEVFDELVFAGSSLEVPVIGTKETVTSFMREDFLDHWNTWYNPENVVIGVVGGIEEIADLQADVEQAFSKGSKRFGGGERNFGLPTQDGPRVKVFYKKTEQAHLVYGFPGLSRQDKKDRYVLSVLMTLLGGNSSSRLFNEIREKRGLAYYAYASADVYEQEGSVYAFEGVSLDKIEEAVKVTREEFERVKGSMSEKEMQRAKEYLIGKMTLDFEDSANVANNVVRKALLEGEVITLEEMLQKIREVELSQLMALSERLFDQKRVNLAVVGPFKDEEKFRELAG